MEITRFETTGLDNPVLWMLITIQIFMGAFDTLVHHEGSERLSWRVSQKTACRSGKAACVRFHLSPSAPFTDAAADHRGEGGSRA